MTLLTGFDLCRAALIVKGVTAPEQSVLTTLAIMANSDAQCWPGIAGLVARTKLSERTVQRAVQGLKDAGHLNWVDKPGRGRIYVVHPRQAGAPVEHTPVTVTPRQPDTRHSDTPVTVTPTPVTVTPKLPRTTIPQKATPSSGTRAPAKPAMTLIPSDFEPLMKAGSITATTVDGWPPGRLEDELEHFVDHHTTKATLSADWQASWRTWVKNSKKWEPRHGNLTSNNRFRPASRSSEIDDAARALGFN